MKPIILPMLAAAALLGACQPVAEKEANVTVTAEANGDEAVETNATDNVAEPANVTATVLAMNDRTRNVVFIRALLDAGIPCDGVESSVRLPDRDGKPLWRANCTGNGGSHMIQITPDGTANIVSRTDR
ncbi:hypothetical protein IAG41_08950 [Sphingomonas sp. JC676]|uniref:hypothetical protein n=1 Tax=Sphingomonas sp. JC676 TaxID=2768065 RepID=UPI0016578895|nr:hypothetical protein [Sphingomonas sp. JC676]MBC9032517.1 hypothetical protein [Sphingomonas sp. JC676]